MVNRFLALATLLWTAPAPVHAGQAVTPSTTAPPATPTPALSQPGGVDADRRTMVAVRLQDDEAIVLDGRLDEAVWRRAEPAADFRQVDPVNGAPATEPTEVRIVYTSKALYMGVWCFDSEPDRWLGFQRRRDEFLQADDRFMWTIDTFLDGRSAYFFEMNPSGLMADSLRGIGTNNRAWDGIWNAKVVRSELGWTLEIEIPFSTLSFDPDGDAWGINFQRTVRRKNEDSLWMGWARNQGLFRMTNAGLVTGLRGLSQGLGLDVKPYGLVGVRSSPGYGEPETTIDPDLGVDLFYSLTPGLRSTLTVNTDFAQTEVDQRLVNLTQFPLFYPEKRDFFLDGAMFFDFQSQQQGENALLPFFSRRIGLDDDGNPQRINVGGKVAGQVGANDLGALYVRTGTEGDVSGEDFLVLRPKRRILRQSYVGALYTGRNTREDGVATRHTVGLDVLLATSSFRTSQNLSVGGFYLKTTGPADTGRSAAFGAVLDYPNDPWSASFLFREVQEHYDAAVGFTPRTGYRRFHPRVEFSPRPRGHQWIRNFEFGAEVNTLVSTVDDRLLNRDWDLTVFEVDLHTQDALRVHVLPKYERLEEDFEISPGIILPRGGEYTYTRYRIQAGTAQRRIVAVSPAVEFGSFYSGTRTRVALDLNLRLRPGVIVYTTSEYNTVDLPEGRFDTRLFRVVPELQFSPWVSLVNNVQFDSQSGILGWQSRFRWILRPGSDLYVVYTQNWQDDPYRARFETLDRSLASKVLYTHRF